MARARNIKPAFFLNDELAELPPLTRLLFIGLWCIADRDGYLEDKPNKIKAEILPYDNCNVDNMLDELNGEFITRYSFEGKRYIFIKNFSKHQNPHMKEKASEIPRIEQIEDGTVLAPDLHNTSRADSFKLITDSLNPQQLIPENQQLDSCIDEVIDFYNENIGMITAYGKEIFEDYIKEMPKELIIYAMQLAVEANARNMKYIKAILNNWSNKGIKTVIEAEKENKDFKKTKGKKGSNFEQREYGDLSYLYANKGE